MMRLLTILLCGAVFLAGCPGGGTTDPPPEPPRVLSVAPAGVVGEAGATVQFAAAVEGSVESYAWEFDGGAIPDNSSDASPEVELGLAGDYTGSLQVTGPNGTSDPFSFSFTVGDSGAPTWERFPAQGATAAATQVRAGLFDDNLVVVYSSLSASPSSSKVLVSISSLPRPKAAADWTTYELSSTAGLGATPMINLRGRPALAYQNLDLSSGIDTRRILWANSSNPQSADDWSVFRVFDPGETPQSINNIAYKSLVPLSNGGLGVAAHSDSARKQYWLSTTTLPPTSDADWSAIQRGWDPNDDYQMAEIDGGLSMAYRWGFNENNVNWTHAQTLQPTSFTEFNTIAQSFGVDFAETDVRIAGFTVLPDRALLISNFGNHLAGQQRGRHQIMSMTLPFQEVATRFDAFVTGPHAATWDTAFSDRAILWDGRLLGHLCLNDEVFLLRSLTAAPDGAEDFESYGLGPGLRYTPGVTAESFALTPLADGGAAALTCGRPGDPPQPLEIWYPDGSW